MARGSLAGFALLAAASVGGCVTPLAQQASDAALVAEAAPPERAPAPARPPRGRRTAALPVPAAQVPVAQAATTQAAAAPDSSAAGWQMPWQLVPLGTASQQAGETVVLSWVPRTGFVRGTPAALEGLGRALEAAPGPNRTVETCRQTVWGEASKSGATEVEAVSAGTERVDRKGDYFAPVHMRVTYQRPSGWEVRESTLTCIVDRRGKIVDAYT